MCLWDSFTCECDCETAFLVNVIVRQHYLWLFVRQLYLWVCLWDSFTCECVCETALLVNVCETALLVNVFVRQLYLWMCLWDSLWVFVRQLYLWIHQSDSVGNAYSLQHFLMQGVWGRHTRKDWLAETRLERKQVHCLLVSPTALVAALGLPFCNFLYKEKADSCHISAISLVSWRRRLFSVGA